ncbi:DMT family transporter [Allosphingosinicella vermicomposti]|uniref:DMT family transporter n=1 Tax=Allosphingosinicella vermicomposti TaxID=614671 RepID=UPI000D0ED11B|nr:DMT family transporter [Allosphingosinicella vermicomposti]
MTPGAGSFRDPKVLIPFIVLTFIWGSTWLVIRDQLGTVPAIWSVTYRFLIAAAAMFAYAKLSGASLRIGAGGHKLALLFGIPQFCLNFNFVYAAEHHVTSGLVAVVFALLMVPNTTLGWLFLKHRITRGFLIGSAIAVAGIALLFVQEMRTSPADPFEIWLGIGLTVCGVLSASVSNVLQASERLRMRPMASMIAWGMFYGMLADGALALITQGPPVIEYRASYLAGLLYLGLFASALAFPLYFGIIRAVGPAKAAYNSLIVPIIAMGLSTIFEGYVWSPLAFGGGLLALVGLFIALRERRASA